MVIAHTPFWSATATGIGIFLAVLTLCGMFWRVASRIERVLETIRDNTSDIKIVKANQGIMQARLIAKTEEEADKMRQEMRDQLNDIKDKEGGSGE